jgi:hypothetical protein
MTKTSYLALLSILLLGGFALLALAPNAVAEQVSREQDIVNLRLGQRMKVDDGTCPRRPDQGSLRRQDNRNGRCSHPKMHSAIGTQDQINASGSQLWCEAHFQSFAGSLGGTGDPVLPAVAPPSIGKVMPVIQRDSSLARNSAP